MRAALLVLILVSGCGAEQEAFEHLPGWVTDERVVAFEITPDVVTCMEYVFHAAEVDFQDYGGEGAAAVCVWTCAEFHGDVGRWVLRVPIDTGHHFAEPLATLERTGCL